MPDLKPQLPTIGWREWISLPDLGIPHLKAKVDTGARTSSIHAHEVEVIADGDGSHLARFKVRPIPSRPDISFSCQAPVVGFREVRDSGGHSSTRPFIITTLQIGTHLWQIEANLTNRDDMLFRMLVGRTSLKGRFLVDSGRSYQLAPQRRNPYQSWPTRP
jgi:hypothetical protein